MAVRSFQDEVVANALRAEEVALRGVLRARVHPDDLDDAFQIAAMRAIRSAGSLRDRDRVVPWLHRLYRNVATDLMRRRARQRQQFGGTIDELPDPATQARVDSCACSISQTQTLADNYAVILSLVDVRGLTLREAASVLGISVNNATVRLHRARKALKKRMRDHCGVETLRDCVDCLCVYEGCCETA